MPGSGVSKAAGGRPQWSPKPSWTEGAGCGGAGARRAIAVGFPTIYHDRSYLDHCTVPRIFVQSTHDEYGPVEELHPFFATLPEPKTLVLIEAADHFFQNALPDLEQSIFDLGG